MEFNKDKSLGKYTIKYPSISNCSCVKSTLYMIDKNGQNVEKFNPNYKYEDIDLDNSIRNDKYEFNFTMADI